jgi:hypothetical protein
LTTVEMHEPSSLKPETIALDHKLLAEERDAAAKALDECFGDTRSFGDSIPNAIRRLHDEAEAQLDSQVKMMRSKLDDTRDESANATPTDWIEVTRKLVSNDPPIGTVLRVKRTLDNGDVTVSWRHSKFGMFASQFKYVDGWNEPVVEPDNIVERPTDIAKVVFVSRP